MFELLVAAIGAPVAKHLVKQWLGDGLTAEIGGGLVDYLKDRVGSEREARRADRVVQDLADSVVERLQPFFETEAGKGVTIEPVVEALRLTLQAHANSRLLLVHRLDPEELYKALQAAGR